MRDHAEKNDVIIGFVACRLVEKEMSLFVIHGNEAALPLFKRFGLLPKSHILETIDVDARVD